MTLVQLNLGSLRVDIGISSEGTASLGGWLPVLAYWHKPFDLVTCPLFCSIARSHIGRGRNRPRACESNGAVLERRGIEGKDEPFFRQTSGMCRSPTSF